MTCAQQCARRSGHENNAGGKHDVAHADKRRNNAAECEPKRAQQCGSDARVSAFRVHSQCVGRSERQAQRDKQAKEQRLVYPETARTAQCYQESGFDPQAVSWAGARGLMQIMPETATHLGLPAHEIHVPEKNIGAAARYLKELERKFRDVPGRLERIRFVLAAYNGGSGHVRDAMALAQKHGKNPHTWKDVAPFILGLARPQYYNDPVVQYGFLRGEETYGNRT